jgi:hypothetical protein
MASQKISQLTASIVLASGDYFPFVQASGTTNKRVGFDVLDNRYYSSAAGTAAQASGNAALVVGSTAQASGNAGIASAILKLPLSGGVVSGQYAGNIVPLSLYGSGINTSLGNYFTATLSGATTVVISGAPSNVAYSFVYEVNHQTGTITWPAAVSWPSATAPTLTTNKTHIFIFSTDDSGTNWRASSLINYTT